MSYQTKSAALVAFMLAISVASTPQNASAVEDCSAMPQQSVLTRPIPLGVSGGNIRSIIKNKKGKPIDCFNGTLGSMVQDSQDNQYILSNNHVLADQNKAKPGQLIIQPGLKDLACIKGPSNAVATFSQAVKLKFGGPKNTVDAAIAAVEPGDVSPEILFIGGIADSVVSAPTLGMAVQKMGRTSCLTTGKIAQVDATFKVNYSDTKKPKLAKFVNQISVTGSMNTPTFGAPGDSGSLIVTADTCPQAVALLFAGSTGGSVPITYGNPISNVLSKLGVSMVGTCTPAPASGGAQADVLANDIGMSKEVVASAAAVRDRHEDELMGIPGAVGTAIGMSDQPGQPAIVIYLKKMTAEAQAAAPQDVEGVPVKLIETGEIVAY